MKYSVISILVPMLVCSCGSIPPYAEPDSSQSAKVRIKNLQPESYIMLMNAVDPEKCAVSGVIGWVSGGKEPDARRVGMLDSEETKEGIVERRVTAGKPISFVPGVWAKLDGLTMLGFGSRQQVQAAQTAACSTPVFTPRTGEEYEVLYNPLPGVCRVSLIRLSAGPEGKVSREEITGNATGSVSAVGPWTLGAPGDLKCAR